MASAKNKIHHYEKIVTTRTEATGISDAIDEARLQIDETTYDALMTLKNSEMDALLMNDFLIEKCV